MNQVNWTDYAAVYDLILQHNPAYRAILRRFDTALATWDLPSNGPIVDLGSGTGNFSLRWASAFPQRQVLHLDMDAGMNLQAERKREAAGLNNLEIRTMPVEEARLARGSVAAVSCVHALYTFAEPEHTLQTIYDWLRPGGWALLCDLGRELDIGDWSRYFARNLVRERGVVGAGITFWRGREILQQNRAIRRRQRRGDYWVHSPSEFRDALAKPGFEIEHAETCFRGYSDFVIASKPLESAAGGPSAPSSRGNKRDENQSRITGSLRRAI